MKARFVEPNAPASRREAIESDGRVQLRSPNDKDFNTKYPAIVQASAAMPEETVIDGEIVAGDESGRPSFSALQNYASSARLLYYVFDVMILAGKDVMNEPLTSAANYCEDPYWQNWASRSARRPNWKQACRT
jgi:ATP-dependent DNA ligase